MDQELAPVNQEARDKITALENAMFALAPEDQIAPLSGATNYFSHGVYSRVWEAKAGEAVVGRIHRFSVMNVLLKGKVRVFSEEHGLVDLEAPYFWVSKPEQKRCVYVIEDVQWMTTHPTDRTEYTDELIDELTVTTYKALEIEKLALEDTPCQQQ